MASELAMEAARELVRDIAYLEDVAAHDGQKALEIIAAIVEAAIAKETARCAEIADDRLEELRKHLGWAEPKRTLITEMMAVAFGIASAIRASKGEGE